MQPIHYILIFGLLGALLLSVLYGLYWAVKRGQFSDFSRGATSIFDAEEPQGYRTDAFPAEARSKSKPEDRSRNGKESE